jgi:abortive infection bacteriophage resistance protein
LQSWLHSLTYIRNLCAHHARLWNRHFTITPIPKLKYRKYLTPNHTFAAQAAMIHIMLNRVSPNSDWVIHLVKLLEKYPNINLARMGFQQGWEKETFWSSNQYN